MNNVSFRKNRKKSEGPKIIKKYGNRKLYDTEQSSYVVLKDIEKMIRNKEDIQIVDNETQDDITVQTLTQIIFCSEKKSPLSTPVDILRTIIQEGDGSLSSFLVKQGLCEEITEEPSQTQTTVSAPLPSSQKTTSREKESIEQKITSLMSSGDGVSENSRDIPKLPGFPTL